MTYDAFGPRSTYRNFKRSPAVRERWNRRTRAALRRGYKTSARFLFSVARGRKK